MLDLKKNTLKTHGNSNVIKEIDAQSVTNISGGFQPPVIPDLESYPLRITIAVTMFRHVRAILCIHTHAAQRRRVARANFNLCYITFYIKKVSSSPAMTRTYCRDINFRRFVHCVSTCSQSVDVEHYCNNLHPSWRIGHTDNLRLILNNGTNRYLIFLHLECWVTNDRNLEQQSVKNYPEGMLIML